MRLARPPRTAESSTLASATRFTFLPPGFEIRQDFPFRQAPSLDLPRHFGAQHGKQLALQFDRQSRLRPRKFSSDQHSRRRSRARRVDVEVTRPVEKTGDARFYGRLSALLFLLRAALVVDSLSFRQHALVQDAGNQNASCVLAVKHNVPAALHPAEARTNIVTLPAQRWVIGKHLATGIEIVEVTDGLVFTPGAERIRSDAEQVGFGPTRETKCGHGLAWL